jgi:3'-phosphoadenosine 5'-phosphosulfate sulfotransferase (PAPS reductase)/FAD synthetase
MTVNDARKRAQEKAVAAFFDELSEYLAEVTGKKKDEEFSRTRLQIQAFRRHGTRGNNSIARFCWKPQAYNVHFVFCLSYRLSEERPTIMTYMLHL